MGDAGLLEQTRIPASHLAVNKGANMSKPKPCRKCGSERSWSDTSKRWRCMRCNYEAQLRRRARLTPEQLEAERARDNRKRNARRAKWTPEKRAEANAQVEAWRKANPDKYVAGHRGWYARNAERARAAKVADYRANPERWYAANLLRKARLNEAVCEHGPKCVSDDFLKALYADACVYCGRPAQHADHFYPIARGGIHCVENIVAACQPCNNSKCARDPFEFIASREGSSDDRSA